MIKDSILNQKVGILVSISRHYLSFTKSYIQILKELQKITLAKNKKKGGSKKDSASLLQKLYKGD